MLRAYLFLRGQFLLARWPLCFFAALAPAFAATKVLPVLNSPISDRAALAGSPLSVNLNSAFGTEAIDDQVVRFTSDNCKYSVNPVRVQSARMARKFFWRG